MAKLIVNEHIYKEVSLGSFHEIEVENALASRYAKVYPGYYFVPFRGKTEYDGKRRHPDFVLIDKQYRTWWIGEVELITHDLHDHVLPQVRVFANSEHGSKTVEKLIQACPELDPDRTNFLIECEPQQVLVVANKFREDWENYIRLEGGRFGVFEMFRSDLGEFIFRINGFVPEAQGPILSEAHLDPSCPNLLKISRPTVIGLDSGNIVQIDYHGVTSDWFVHSAGDKMWLRSDCNRNLSLEKIYLLRRDELGAYYLEAKF